jgi:predicted transposase YbfD/YdcC
MESNTVESLTEKDFLYSLSQMFENLTDKRARRGRRYRLAPLLVILVLAKLCGEDKPKAIAQWVEYRAMYLKEVLGLAWKRMPHHATWRRVLDEAIDLSEFELIASRYLSSLARDNSSVLNLDGKTLKGTIPLGEKHGLHLLALQESNENLVVKQTAMQKKENEISCAKRLLSDACLQGKIVTGDAIFAQKDLSRIVVDKGGDYLWRVKLNQEKLCLEIENGFKTKRGKEQFFDKFEDWDKGHGRIERRIVCSSSRIADSLDFPFASQVFFIKREVTNLSNRNGQREGQIFYGITSLPPMEADAKRLLELTRKHWAIENGLHYRRDVTFKEDSCKSKSRKAAQALAICNNLALGIIRHEGWDNVPQARRFYAANIQKALELLLKLNL